ncbi:MAG: CapA family protein [Halanaerobiales bacterium]|nr:CapA family protein [Halanaerobiales bacterium]
MHLPQVKSGLTDDGYDFNYFFQYVKPIFTEADFVIGNLETTFAGPARTFTGYPAFNSPDELAIALKESGFNIITTANNHSLDKGESGLLRTLDQLDLLGLAHTGTFRTQEEQTEICVVEKNGISMAVLAYTYGTNVPISEGKGYLVNVIDLHKMKTEIDKAHQIGVDLVLVSVHFGEEYQRRPNKKQHMIVDYLFSCGVDLIIGSHPHVLQPYKIYEWFTAMGEPRKGVVSYSLGNFISNQRTFPRNFGGILSVEIEKNDKKTEIKEVGFIQTYVYRYYNMDKHFYRVLPMKDFLDSKDLWKLEEADYQLFKKQYEEINQQVSSLLGDSRTSFELCDIYTIKAGDNLYNIAKNFNTTVMKITEVNPYIIPQRLQIGEMIYVPKRTTD